ncbi:nitrate reductase cytochrome c-type subunit [Sulfurivermis fontis]|uniref:nitrate reductase cytochrome c-type subunit n=1 Tax=Sulfurivermis fontis TaxID=1972068 RepID=UPI000FD75C90|nr:nitrate reductase cytochrome c-type subunit [Sulfurivermis fontis]
MKRSMVLGGVMLLAMLANAPLWAAGVVSLRGDQEISHDSQAVEIKHWQDRDPIPRDYVQQPPLIPHTVEGYVINQKVNKCLTCHSWANYKQNKATKISQTHFADREGNDLANVSARRYFCTQCHVPQADAAPLVENTFQPLPTISNR